MFYLTAQVTEPLFLAAAVVFLMWFWRCRVNAEVLAPGRHSYSSGMAVGSWFIPGLMWWAPWRVALDVWRASGAVGGSPLVNAWWIAWLVKSVGVSAYMVLDLRGDPNAPWTVAVNSVAAVLAVIVIRRVSTAQSAMFRS
ncbi:DUF4328 domain-containing protein [Kitasatospora sp. NPDC053057]|uniref:DUF4328 domain-containing protein n=1 Tax=Kitasatospora sp. NPDC053057 TaxID=3364062 RepID=UPI0037C4FD1D